MKEPLSELALLVGRVLADRWNQQHEQGEVPLRKVDSTCGGAPSELNTAEPAPNPGTGRDGNQAGP